SPMRQTFPVCCASAMTAKASNTTRTRIDGIEALFIARLVSSVMYHADRDKGKCDLHSGRRQGLFERKAGFTLTLSCTLQSNVASDWFVGEFSSILASQRDYLITF